MSIASQHVPDRVDPDSAKPVIPVDLDHAGRDSSRAGSNQSNHPARCRASFEHQHHGRPEETKLQWKKQLDTLPHQPDGFLFFLRLGPFRMPAPYPA